MNFSYISIVYYVLLIFITVVADVGNSVGQERFLYKHVIALFLSHMDRWNPDMT